MSALSDTQKNRVQRVMGPGWRRLLLAMGLAFMMMKSAEAQDPAGTFTESIAALVGANDTLLEIDPPRNSLTAVAHVFFRRNGPFASAGYRVDFQLLDEAGELVPFGPDPGEVTVSSPMQVVVSTNPQPPTELRTFVASLVPTTPLSHTQKYRLRAYVQLLDIATQTLIRTETALIQPEGQVYWHFPSSDPDDASWNILARAESFEPEKTSYQIWQENHPSRMLFFNSLAVELRRADHWDRPDEDAEALQVETHVRVRLRLINVTTAEDVPLTEWSGGESTFTLAPFAPGVDPDPRQAAAETGFVHCSFAPQSLEDISPLYRYRLEAVVEHTDDGAGTLVTDNTVVYDDIRLVRLSGKLLFGEIETMLDVFAPGLLALSSSANVGGEVPGQLTLLPQMAWLVEAPVRRLPSQLVVGSAIVWQPNGDLRLVAGTVPVAGADSTRQQGVRVNRGPITLHAGGGSVSQITIYLPAGLGFAFEPENGRLQASFTRGPVALNGRLEVAALLAIENPGGWVYLVHERLPHRVRVDRLEWQAGSGLFTARVRETQYVRAAELAALESVRTTLTTPWEADRPSNEKYLRDAAVTGSEAGGAEVLAVRSDEDGRARLDANLTIPEVNYQTHFPLGLQVRARGGQLAIRDSVVDITTSQLTGAQPMTFDYSLGIACNGGAGQSGPVFTPENETWQFTVDGGLHAPGTIPARDFNFGLTSEVEPVHSVLQVSEGRFHIPGHVLSGGVLGEELPDNFAVHRPAVLLLSGQGARVERPLTSEYEEGLADYAGFNFEATNGLMARSNIAGEAIGPYTLKPRSKYYFRPSGASGIHDAVTAEILPLPKFYGYELTFDGLRLAYLDNRNVDSAIGGEVTLPAPSDFSVTLTEIKLDLHGELLGGRVVNPTQKRLAYWQMPFTPTSADFVRSLGPGGCPVGGTGLLALQVRAFLPAITDAPIYGRLGFTPNGRLVSRADAPGTGLDSRLVLPSTLSITTPSGGRFRFTPVTGAALNSYDNPERPVDGFVSMAGLLDVPFFEDIKVHLHASASGAATADSRLHVMGGWANDPAFEAEHNLGWTEGGRNFFNDPNFDASNRGWPQGITLESYRNNKSASGALEKKYHPLARKVWRGVVELNYSTEWDVTRRVFTGFNNPEVRLLVLKAHHELRTLSTEGCSITFGAELSTPRLNVSDLLAERLMAGAERSISRALQGVFSLPVSEMASGIDGLEKVVNDRLSVLMNEALSTALDAPDGVTDRLYTNLKNFYEVGTIEDRIGRLATLAPGGNELNLGGSLNLPTQVMALADAGSPVVNSLRTSLQGALNVCQSALDVMAPDRRDKVRQAVQQLAAWGGLSPGELGQLNQALAEAEAGLREAEAFLRRVRSTLQDLLAQIDGQGALVRELRRALEQAAGQAEAEALARVRDIFAAEHDLTGRYFEEVSEAQAKARISRVLREALCSGALASRVQPVLRARFNDVRERFRSGLDLVFGEFNRVLVAAVRGSVRQGTEAFAELLDSDGAEQGDPSQNSGVGDFFAVARLEGYAQISGEKIQEIRLNSSLRLKVSDALVVDGWFRLLNCDSDTPNTSCREPGVVSTEVTVGAHGEATFGVVPIEVGLEGKFSFNDAGSLVGLDGSFDLRTHLAVRQASLDRVSFKFGFGGGEGYLSGRVGATVDFVQMEGFCFFGATKNARALDLLDEETRDLINVGALGAADPATGCFPTALTGFYQGFEGSISINAFFRIPDTCFLRLNAIVGSGNFCFIQGSAAANDLQLVTGVRYAYGVRGEILCLVDITGRLGTAVAVRLPVGNPTNLLKPDAFLGALKDAEASGTASLRLSGKVGPCPFCKSFSKSFTLLVKMSRQGGVDVKFK